MSETRFTKYAKMACGRALREAETDVTAAEASLDHANAMAWEATWAGEPHTSDLWILVSETERNVEARS